jgi:hypothetical protein
VEPVFESIARSAAQLCAASVAFVVLLDGDTLIRGAVTITADEWALRQALLQVADPGAVGLGRLAGNRGLGFLGLAGFWPRPISLSLPPLNRSGTG